jgi:signal transduction histidine kinase
MARDLARGLHPVDVTTHGLRDALRDLAFRRSTPNLTLRFECPRPVRIREEALGLQLFRIAQEAVNNAIKHAKAREIAITLHRTRSALVLQIRDDGEGFREREAGCNGMGLDIMHHRASVIGGWLKVESQPGRGTTVTCTLAGE